MTPSAQKNPAVPPGALHHGKRVSRKEYLKLEDDGHLYDMIDGVLYVTPSPFFEHAKRAGSFEFELRAYLKRKPRGEVVHEVDVFLPDGGDALRPDVCFILRERLSIVDGHIYDAPGLVCEVLSTSTAARDLGIKADRYLANGVREYWIIDPRDRTAQLRFNAGDRWRIQTGDRLSSELLPGFGLNVREFFES